MLGALVHLGGSATYGALEEMSGYSHTPVWDALNRLMLTVCVERPRKGTFVITERGRIAFALLQGAARTIKLNREARNQQASLGEPSLVSAPVPHVSPA